MPKKPPTTYRSDAEIERSALELRKFLVPADDDIPNMEDVLRRAAEHPRSIDLAVVVKPDSEMQNAKAYAISESRRIFVKESVWRNVTRKEERARFTIAHELAHIYLHSGERPRPCIVSPSQMSGIHGNDEASERQASLWASFFLIPRHKLSQGMITRDVSEQFGVSLSVALLRLEHAKNSGARKELPEYREVRKRLEAQVLGHASQRELPRKAQAAWDRCRPSGNKDPDEFRISDRNYEIEYKYYDIKRNCQTGWFEIRDQARNFMELDDIPNL